MSKSIKYSLFFCARSYRSIDIAILTFDIQRVGECQWSTIITMTTFDCKCKNQTTIHFALALTVPEILNFNLFYLHQVAQDHGVKFSY